MVRAKEDTAFSRIAARAEAARKRVEDIEQNTVRVKWQVIEHTPGYNTGGYYDQDISAKNVVVQDDLDSEEAAQQWMDRHEADPGKRLFIKQRRLVRRTYTVWI